MSRRVLVVDDHALVAQGLKLGLSARGWEIETTSGPTAEAVVGHAQRFQPDCVLLDIDLGAGVGSGVDLVRPLVAAGAHVVMVSAETKRTIFAACIEAGAAGFLSKGASFDEVDAALELVLAGHSLLGRTSREALLDELRDERAGLARRLSPFDQLTPRESLVLAAMTEGLSAEEIARTHFVALATVRSQIRAVLQKLGVNTQLAAVAVANRSGWTPPTSALAA
jgi:DNA-binding NarL/FixJ family response regulator